ncbi:MAG: alternative ribosome rescue aminoacyl-tRNA hydrolase ArfB [Myxococcota bacterium]|nr:alternative ribosome rescue aminoacyl-tRNA hydrolase ArfB [Myxococcota bacterium]
MSDPLPITSRLTIPGALLEVETSRSGGPGGQHVNKTDTRVRLRFDLKACDALNGGIKSRIRRAHPGKITTEGVLLVVCGTHRSQSQNLEEARERLKDIIRSALTPPKKRKPTRPTKGSKERRLASKKQRSEVKQGRRKVRGRGED